MATSKVPTIINYLVTQFTNAGTIGQASPPVRIFDGPTATMETAQRTIWVGVDDPEDPDQGAEMEQEWAALGAQKRDEMFTIHCVAEAWDGLDVAMAATRDAVFGIVAAVENLLRADVNLGGNCLFAGVIPSALIQRNVERGVLARVPFRIEGKARI